jgi:hypothetical protein
MDAMFVTMAAAWNRLPAKVRGWLQGLEVAVAIGTVSAVLALPAADLTTRAGVLKFAATVLGAAGVCVRLYLRKSPLQDLLD